jgi:hypothetical protein
LKAMLLILLLTVFALPAFSEDEDSPQDETVFPGDFRHGYFGGLTAKLSSVNREFGTIAGLRGGWIPKRSYSLGIGAYYLVTGIEVENVVPDSTLDLMFGYAGPEFEYVNRSHKLIHYTIGFVAGPGVIDYVDYDCETCEDKEELDMDLFFVFEPTVNIMVNMHPLLRMGFGVGYRYVYGVELKGVADKDLRSPSAVVTFKFGRF